MEDGRTEELGKDAVRYWLEADSMMIQGRPADGGRLMACPLKDGTDGKLVLAAWDREEKQSRSVVWLSVSEARAMAGQILLMTDEMERRRKEKEAADRKREALRTLDEARLVFAVRRLPKDGTPGEVVCWKNGDGPQGWTAPLVTEVPI